MPVVQLRLEWGFDHTAVLWLASSLHPYMVFSWGLFIHNLGRESAVLLAAKEVEIYVNDCSVIEELFSGLSGDKAMHCSSRLFFLLLEMWMARMYEDNSWLSSMNRHIDLLLQLKTAADTYRRCCRLCVPRLLGSCSRRRQARVSLDTDSFASNSMNDNDPARSRSISCSLGNCGHVCWCGGGGGRSVRRSVSFLSDFLNLLPYFLSGKERI